MIQMNVLNPVPKDKVGARHHVAPFTQVDFQEFTAGIVIIGNEILSGMIKDSNSMFMARELSAQFLLPGESGPPMTMSPSKLYPGLSMCNRLLINI
jgi:hypothetical protein